jgi:hypothetical protein
MAEINWGNLLGTALTTAGSIYNANQTANANTNAANTAAQASQFRPVGITTRFGRSGFTYGPDGRLTGASYQVAPDVAAMREAVLGVGGGALAQTQEQQAFQNQVNQASQGLFTLGNQYLAQSPQAAAQQWMQGQQALLAPQDERALAQLQNTQFQRGSQGLSMGATSGVGGVPGLRAANPAMEAFFNAQQQRNAGLAAQAQQMGQQQATFGQGLLGGALNLRTGGYNAQQAAFAPFGTAFQQATNIENQGLNALQQGTALGSPSTAAAQQAAAYQMQAANANNQARSNLVSTGISALQDPVSQLLGKLFGG